MLGRLRRPDGPCGPLRPAWLTRTSALDWPTGPRASASGDVALVLASWFVGEGPQEEATVCHRIEVVRGNVCFAGVEMLGDLLAAAGYAAKGDDGLLGEGLALVLLLAHRRIPVDSDAKLPASVFEHRRKEACPLAFVADDGNARVTVLGNPLNLKNRDESRVAGLHVRDAQLFHALAPVDSPRVRAFDPVGEDREARGCSVVVGAIVAVHQGVRHNFANRPFGILGNVFPDGPCDHGACLRIARDEGHGVFHDLVDRAVHGLVVQEAVPRVVLGDRGSCDGNRREA